ncbi:MAG: hypothetical protein EXS13_04645 [Planctomycetes bacterium]|nr:hypothetical protein [Planctomycetota bacterium]
MLETLRARNSCPRPVASRPALALLCLALCGCSNVAPWLDRSYLRAGPVAMNEELKVDAETEKETFLGVGATLGTLLEIERTRAVGLEAGIDAYNLDSGNLDGYGFRYRGGPRWQWNLDGHVRPSVGVGASWTDFHFHDHQRGSDPAGLGAYADLGCDWMLTPTFGIGARLRDNFRYDNADENHGFRNAIEFALETVWRF